MRKVFTTLLLLATFTACQNNSMRKIATSNHTIIEDGVGVNKSDEQMPTSNATEEENSSNIDAEEISIGKSLNEIRFANWTPEDWLDNDYIKEMRSFFDSYSQGTIDDARFEALAPYKSLMKGQFTVLDVEPFIGGGLFMLIAFMDNPKQVFDAWVYGDIENEEEGVIGYDVRLCRPSKTVNNLSKEEILKILKEYPENKLW